MVTTGSWNVLTIFFHLPWVLSPDDHWDIYGLSLGQNIDVYEIGSQSLDGIASPGWV